MQVLEIIYLGRCKDKGRGSQAFGWIDGGWSAIFPEAVLRAWFADDAAPGEQSSLYAVLGVRQSDAPEVIKAGYRRMALQWHPDRNRDPDAHNQFLRVQEAYEILSNANKRARYDAGLKLQASIKTESYENAVIGYRAPLKCGLVMVDGEQSGKWFVVKKILEWADITRADGRVLSAAWPYGAKKPLEAWL